MNIMAAATSAGRPPIDSALPLVAQLGSEVAGTLSSALDRVLRLAATGRIDRVGLRALHDEIDRARRAAIVGQQLARLGAGDVDVGRERLDLALLLHAAVSQRQAQTDARGLELRLRLKSAPVDSDATLLFTLLQSLLDWACEHAAGRVELQVEPQAWPARTQLGCRFAHTAPDTVDSAAMPLDEAPRELDNLAWRLLEQTAALLSLGLTRQDDARFTELTLDIPERPLPLADGVLSLSVADAAAPIPSPAGTPDGLAGLQVLVFSSRREVRNVATAALRPLAVLVDVVETQDEALHFCREGLPHVLLHDEGLAPGALSALRAALPAAPAGPVLMVLAEHGRWLEMHQLAGIGSCRIGRDGIFTALPLALRLMAAAQALR